MNQASRRSSHSSESAWDALSIASSGGMTLATRTDSLSPAASAAPTPALPVPRASGSAESRLRHANSHGGFCFQNAVTLESTCRTTEHRAVAAASRCSASGTITSEASFESGSSRCA